MNVVVGLGASLGNRLRSLRLAIARLDARPDVSVVRRSRVYMNPPAGPARGAFFNAAALLETSLEPLELMLVCQRVEGVLGRPKNRVRWSDRVVDIDLLVAEDRIVDTEMLRLPHREMLSRPFALLPAAEVAPGSVHPLADASLQTLAGDLTHGLWPVANL